MNKEYNLNSVRIASTENNFGDGCCLVASGSFGAAGSISSVTRGERTVVLHLVVVGGLGEGKEEESSRVAAREEWSSFVIAPSLPKKRTEKEREKRVVGELLVVVQWVFRPKKGKDFGWSGIVR
ncbi:hypothetical protein KY289_001081 [Solanum tuberosum]|nr:hypothetical protein KY289_001081 [Solanum tuberosum]